MNEYGVKSVAERLHDNAYRRYLLHLIYCYEGRSTCDDAAARTLIRRKHKAAVKLYEALCAVIELDYANDPEGFCLPCPEPDIWPNPV